MELDPDDLDWAMGKLLHLFSQANRFGIYPHELRPDIFHPAWAVLSRQPFEVAKYCYDLLMAQIPRPLHHLEIKSAKKRYAYSVTH